MNNTEANSPRTADAQTVAKDYNLYPLFDKLSYAEKNELCAMMLRGLIRAGKLAQFVATDDHLWAIASGVQTDCLDIQGDILDMSLAGRWDAEIRAAQ